MRSLSVLLSHSRLDCRRPGSGRDRSGGALPGHRARGGLPRRHSRTGSSQHHQPCGRPVLCRLRPGHPRPGGGLSHPRPQSSPQPEPELRRCGGGALGLHGDRGGVRRRTHARHLVQHILAGRPGVAPGSGGPHPGSVAVLGVRPGGRGGRAALLVSSGQLAGRFPGPQPHRPAVRWVGRHGLPPGSVRHAGRRLAAAQDGDDPSGIGDHARAGVRGAADCAGARSPRPSTPQPWSTRIRSCPEALPGAW